MQGSEWQRLCLLGMSTASASDAVVSSQSGGGGSVKVREMTDLLGVSNSFIFPPLRSSLWEKGLNRAGGAKVAVGGVSEGWSMSDLLRERRWSNSRPRDRLRTGLTGGEVASESRTIVLVYRSETVLFSEASTEWLTFDSWFDLLFSLSLFLLQLCYDLGERWTELCVHLSN